MSTMDKLQDVFRDVFDSPELIISDSTTPDDIEDWDSLGHVNLIVSSEKAFKIKFPIKKLVAIKTAKDLADVIDEELEKLK